MLACSIEAEAPRLWRYFFIDEVFIKLNGKQYYLWRAVDQDGEEVDVYLQAKRDGAAAKQFFKRLLHNHGREPAKVVKDKLCSCPIAHREITPEGHRACTKMEQDCTFKNGYWFGRFGEVHLPNTRQILSFRARSFGDTPGRKNFSQDTLSTHILPPVRLLCQA
jgi:hypothetical protein